jgi:hypothetical protein
MFLFDFYVSWPWGKNSGETGRDYFYREWQISKNKSFEIQLSKYNVAKSLFSVRFDTRWVGEDHAGPAIYVEIWKYLLNIQLYDHRHWNYEEARWYSAQEEHAQNSEQVDDRAKYHYEQYLHHLSNGNHSRWTKTP